MTDLITAAHRRIDELEAELEELRSFLAVAGRLAGGRAPTRGPRANASRAARVESGEFKGSSPKQIVSGLMGVLADGETLDRDELIRRLAERDVVVPGMYANKNLGTILWRNQRLFEHLKGKGYRWTGAKLEE